ncbi:SRPBCC domain-containing protein [Subtercola sp. PAMC28395]|uniref:SRPBCC domain-containing protein n=1 Tax=Subtercola sp. PAMC28395 TaxID=2846775 RepID=UPI001C0D2C7C|nr:SRPBCC domain-containing protein [Subtercola sp. PAMC28395]QWT23385.1 SRPBCC domain-containing protein [Subtercola sp. PAMC28395]
MIEPLALSISVACPVDHAFRVWTSKISSWWPTGHTVSGSPDVAVVLEPGVGGRIFERESDGQEHEWGEITHWDPPHRFGYLWHIRRQREDATDVDIHFVAVGENETRVEIIHSGWERLGADAQQWRDRNQGGWGGLLPHFIAAAESSNT